MELSPIGGTTSWVGHGPHYTVTFRTELFDGRPWR
jgi:hypothetical protein